MNENLLPSHQTSLFVGVFLILYIGYLLKTTLRGGIDIYDFFLLASVGFLPAIFTFFPHSTLNLTLALGVRYPFIILFGLLFFVVFFYLIRLVIRIHRLQLKERTLAQELAMLREEMKK